MQENSTINHFQRGQYNLGLYARIRRFSIQGITDKTKKEGWRLGIFKASFKKIK